MEKDNSHKNVYINYNILDVEIYSLMYPDIHAAY